MEMGHTLHVKLNPKPNSTRGSWIYTDLKLCSKAEVRQPLACYFGPQNSCGKEYASMTRINYDPEDPKRHNPGCPSIIDEKHITTSKFRAASMELLFSHVDRRVISEAERLIPRVFGADGVPKNLITVHIRWGDKYTEMKLLTIDNYLEAAKKLARARGLDDAQVSVYVASDDARALQGFRRAAPPGWKVFDDPMLGDLRAVPMHKTYFDHVFAARMSQGYEGVESLASLLISLEAEDFVLTTGSNWSRLINELRLSVLDPRCGGCTKMIDLLEGES